jgi:hypothetical protein
MQMISTKSDKPAVTLPVLIGVIVALVAFIAAVGYLNFRPRPADTRRRVVSAEEQQQVAQQTVWLKQKAQETGGDWRKLDPQDQQQLKMIAKDQFETILTFYAKSK